MSVLEIHSFFTDGSTLYRASVRLKFYLLLITSLVICTAMAYAQTPSAHLHGEVFDENGSPISGAEIVLISPQEKKYLSYSNVTGRFDFYPVNCAEYQLTANKPGFFRISKSFTLTEGDNNILLVMNHESEIHERVEVTSAVQEINSQSTSNESSLVAREITDIPVPSTHNFRSSLPALPEVLEDNANQIHIAGGRENEIQFILDGFDIGDPVTGRLTARLNVDAIRLMQAESGHYASQYGNGATGILALETAVGDDRWRQTLTNFIPDVKIQDGLRLGNWYPRYTISGPLSRGRMWFSEALSLQRNVHIFQELPQKADTITQWSGDNLIRAQVKLTPTNILQGGFLYNQQYGSKLGLTPFSPVETTTTLRSHRLFFFLKDQTWTKRTYYEVGVAGDLGYESILPAGNQTYIVTPVGTSGNYFESVRRENRRWQLVATAAMPSRHWRGTHDLQMGINTSVIEWNNSALRGTIEVRRADNSLAQHTTFSGPSQFHLSDYVFGLYVQDTWQIARSFVFRIGLREDHDRILGSPKVSTRLSANFLPFGNKRTKFTVGWGIFVQPLQLSFLGPIYDQQRKDVFYGTAPDNPIVASITSRFIHPSGGLKQPWFSTISLIWEQKFGSRSFVGVNFTDRKEHSGLAYESTLSETGDIRLMAANNRRDKYRSAQISFRHTFVKGAEVSASYARSRAQTNEVFDYSLGTLVFAPQKPGPLPWDTPNRFLSSGWAPIPFWHLFASYFLEYRSGFPFSAINERQQLVGEANSLRFPDYFNLNVGIEKQVQIFRRKWAVRLTIVNATSHFNPEAVIKNVDAPNYLLFTSSQDRSFSGRIRLVDW